MLSNNNAGPRALALSSTTVPISLFQSAPWTVFSSPCASTSISHDRKSVFIFAPVYSSYRQESFHVSPGTAIFTRSSFLHANELTRFTGPERDGRAALLEPQC